LTFLLDTNVLLWALGRPAELPPLVREKLRAAENTVFVSVVCAWEIEIKRALGKLRAPDDLDEQLRRQRFTELPVHLRHVQGLRRLPPLHRDPFDRMLMAQALTDDLVLVTADQRLRQYPVKTLPC
jgi:PIN domain nuclease of toxin-antitoxin system